MRVLVIHGPNLNLLGERQPEIYGQQTLDEIDDFIRATARDLGIEVECVQYNGEGEIIDAIHTARANLRRDRDQSRRVLALLVCDRRCDRSVKIPVVEAAPFEHSRDAKRFAAPASRPRRVAAPWRDSASNRTSSRCAQSRKLQGEMSGLSLRIPPPCPISIEENPG